MNETTGIIIGASVSVIILIITAILHTRANKAQNAKFAKDEVRAKSGPNFYTEMGKIGDTLTGAVDSLRSAKNSVSGTVSNIEEIGKTILNAKQVNAGYNINNN